MRITCSTVQIKGRIAPSVRKTLKERPRLKQLNRKRHGNQIATFKQAAAHLFDQLPGNTNETETVNKKATPTGKMNSPSLIL